MTGLKDLQQLVDEFCDPYMRRVEWVKPGSSCRHCGSESQRHEMLPADRDWIREFEQAIEACEGDLSFIRVELPMAPTGHDGPYGSGSWYWTDFDDSVFPMLRSHGAEFSFPKPYMGKYFDSDLTWFYLFCPPSVSELLLEDHGVSVCEFDFSDSIMGMSLTVALKISGNEGAFRWLRENRPDALNVKQVKIQELFNTSLVVPLAEETKDASLSSPKLYDGLKDMIANRKLREASALEPKLKLTEAKAKELLALVEQLPAEESGYLEKLIEDLNGRVSSASAARKPSAGRKKPLSWNAKRINEFVSFAKHGDIASMAEYLESVGGELPGVGPLGEQDEGASRARYRLWAACCNNLDVALLEFLVSRGLDVRQAVEASSLTLLSQILHSSRALSTSPFPGDLARAFLVKLLEEGVRCEDAEADDAWSILLQFPGDHELFDRLRTSGMPFHYESVFEEGESDAENIKMAIECSDERDAGWEDVAYLLSHGATLSGTSDSADDVWRRIEEDPAKIAAVVESIPPNTISPAARLLPAIAASGSIQALRALESWDGVYEGATVDIAIGKASSEGMTEVVAYLLEKKADDGNAVMSLDLEDEARSPELAEAIGLCAVTSELALRDCDLLPKDGDAIVIPDGVRAIEDNAFSHTLATRPFVWIPDSVIRYPKPNKLESIHTLSLPRSAEPSFEEIFICSAAEEVFVRGEEGMLRAMVKPCVAISFAGYRTEGDPGKAVRMVWEGVELNRDDGSPTGSEKASYAAYVGNIDKLFADKTLKHFANRSRLAVCRLIDRSHLSEEHRAMYEKWLRRNAGKCEKHFAEHDMRVFSELLPIALESIDG